MGGWCTQFLLLEPISHAGVPMAARVPFAKWPWDSSIRTPEKNCSGEV